MTVPVTIVVPEYFNYLLAVLGLLLVWKLHEISVQKGRIQAVDFWDRSGIRMFIHVTPNDRKACPACEEATGTVLLPTVVDKRKFRPLSKSCSSPAGCRCLMVGLYGGWPDAQQLLATLKAKQGVLRLSTDKLQELLNGPWERYAGAAGDRIPVHLLEAMLLEGTDPEAAIFRYRFVEGHAKRERDFPLVMHSFIRRSELLERVGRPKEALMAVEEFFAVYTAKSKVANVSNDAVFNLMSNKKSHLAAVLK